VTAVPLVSVVIPALNEAEDIAGCIDALAAQDYPLSSIEILLVDGDGEDATVERAQAAAAPRGFKGFRALRNPRRRTSCALNVGLAEAAGEVLVRIDARSRVEPHYVRTCVEVLADRPEVGEIGGAQLAIPRTANVVDVGLARAQRNRITSGFSRYRRATSSVAAEHVWMGTFRTEELRALGGWDDATALNEDFELSQRYIKAGKVVWFDARLQSGYLARATIPALARQHFYFGRVKGMWWARGRRPLARQVALIALPPTALIGAAVACKRLGVAPVGLAAVATAFAVEAAGCSGPTGGPRERAVSLGGIATYGSSWWAGTIAGFLGEKAGVEHRHG
jgi:succinoglycan biosynthesis protein ExoA